MTLMPKVQISEPLRPQSPHRTRGKPKKKLDLWLLGLARKLGKQTVREAARFKIGTKDWQMGRECIRNSAFLSLWPFQEYSALLPRDAGKGGGSMGKASESKKDDVSEEKTNGV